MSGLSFLRYQSITSIMLDILIYLTILCLKFSLKQILVIFDAPKESANG
ncbi:MAG: hypothetical protein HW390_1348 [Candidatus Brocadiaceae bacterium]|nr:hypothetical protein [Candidatus Brocadiaceae bacterium]